jgi:hypothetical protein
MSDLAALFSGFASEVSALCSHISVRSDENGPYVFALGLKETHTLQLRKQKGSFVVQLWHGKTAEEERIVGEPRFPSADRAFQAAKEWLAKDAA